MDCKVADKIQYLEHCDLIELEKHWKHHVSRSFSKIGLTEKQKKGQGNNEKKYVLAMFPYPSGKLHMGHVRVYTCSDAFARFYHLNGFKVFHPIGWDAFGLPAENAAINNKENPSDWTRNNIKYMKAQLEDLGCSFEWNNELATCDPAYIKATQTLFLKLYARGLAYQNEAHVNWDPVDKTVLADEQVDKDLCSWRSGAKVEKKHLKQWFIKTTKYCQCLYDDLKLTPEGWDVLVKLQKHWIGKSTGYKIWLMAWSGDKKFHIHFWVKNPQYLRNASFICIKTEHPLAKEHLYEKVNTNAILLKLKVFEPLTKRYIPVMVCDDVPYIGCEDAYVALGNSEIDRTIGDLFSIKVNNAVDTIEVTSNNQQIIEEIKSEEDCDIFPCSPILKDWLISRQRFWGTPIPIVHCDACGTVPVEEKELPVLLPTITSNVIKGSSTLANHQDWINVKCPKCKGPANRESDTMDTFVDSSYYYLRFLDPHNNDEIVKKEIARSKMPVDLYVGGEEHAVLHLYYTRFIHKFLVKEGISFGKEPFHTFLPLGLVKSKTLVGEKSGKYLTEEEVDFNASPPTEKATKEPVIIKYDKMSKSKHNGIDPQDIINSHGIDLVRLTLFNCNIGCYFAIEWGKEDLLKKNILILQKLHRTLRQYQILKLEGNDLTVDLSEDVFRKSMKNMRDERDIALLYIDTHGNKSTLIRLLIDKLMAIYKSILNQPRNMILSTEYEKSLRTMLLLLFPICPHFSSEYWSLMNKYGNNLGDIINQEWPRSQSQMKFNFIVKVGRKNIYKGGLIPTDEVITLDGHQAFNKAKKVYPGVVEALKNRKIVSHLLVKNIRNKTVEYDIIVEKKLIQQPIQYVESKVS